MKYGLIKVYSHDDLLDIYMYRLKDFTEKEATELVIEAFIKYPDFSDAIFYLTALGFECRLSCNSVQI